MLSDCRKSRILTGRRGRRPLQMAILRIMNVGANCVRPQTTMFIDNLNSTRMDAVIFYRFVSQFQLRTSSSSRLYGVR